MLFLEIMLILSIFSPIAIWSIVSQQRQLLIEQEQQYYDLELNIISKFLKGKNFSENLSPIINVLNNIAQQHTHITTLKATMKDGSKLFHYSRPKTNNYTKRVHRRINLDTNNYLDITIYFDFSDTEWIVASLYKKLLLAFTIFIVLLGVTLWIVIKKFALNPLKLEQEKQKIAILQQANHDLRVEAIKNQRLIQIIESTNDLISWATPEGKIIYINQAGIKLLGWSLNEEITTKKIADAHPSWAKDVILNQGIPIAIQQGIWQGETALLTYDGREIPTSQVIMSHTSLVGEVEFISTIIRDISEQKQAKQAIMESEKRFKALFDTMTNGVAVYDILNEGEDFIFKDFNKAAERINEISKTEVLGRCVTDVFPGVREFGLLEVFRRVYRTGKPELFPVTFYQDNRLQGWRENYVYKLDSGEIVAIHDDITERKQLEEKLKKQAEYDNLTGLPNRTLFRDRFSQILAMSKRYCVEKVALMFIDLDRFKVINDTLGHDAGDQLLQMAAERIVSCVRKSDTVARLGGDEFTLILPALSHQMHAELIARKILKALAKPFSIFGEDVFISGSIGITIFPDDGNDIDEMTKNADSAMYQAKEDGRNKFRFFTAEMNVRAFQRMKIEKDLRIALENEELSVHYQPKIDILSGKIIGMEALIRWEHPESGTVFPDDFIEVAESTGLIVPIGNWILETACRQTQSWLESENIPLYVAVNLSARQLERQDCSRTVRRILEKTQLEPQYLELEITESMMMKHLEQAVITLGKLEKMGVRIAMDDFGTGYSSLDQLKRLPIHTLKIDKSFVRDITTDAEDAAIISAIISLANSLQLEVVAEGVESQEQIKFLQEKGCRFMQGFYFSHPLPATEFIALLKQNNAFDSGSL